MHDEAMPGLADLDDLDLSTVELADGTPLLAAWTPGPDGSGVWVARGSLPASAVTVQLDPMRNMLVPDAFYPESATVQEVFDLLLHDGFNIYRRVTDDDPERNLGARLGLLTDYRRDIPFDQVGGNGAVFGLSYGWPGAPAGGNVNVTVIGAEVRASEDPANEVGGCIASLQLGRGTDPPPTASLWGSSYTLRGSVGRQPGGLMAYTAVVQNYFDGPGSRSDNYGFAAVTRPGIGDGHDFHHHDPIRHSTTYPVDYGFVVCGDSGAYPDGGDVGYRVAFQAGGAASPWATREQWRTRIGTGLLVRDWLESGIHVHPPHPDAGAVPQLRLDRRDGQAGNYLECRSQDGLGLMAAIGADGRIRAADGQDPAEVVTVGQLEAAMASLRAELGLAGRSGVGPDGLSGATTRELGGELASRLSPLRPRFWRSVRRKVARLRPAR
jgi:hypothetical protein